VVLNKVDKPDAEPARALNEVFDLFANLGATDEQLDFPHLYASGRSGWADAELDGPRKDLNALFDLVMRHVPAPAQIARRSEPFQMLATTLSADPFIGRILTGRVEAGTLRAGETIKAISGDTIRFGDGSLSVAEILGYLKGSTSEPTPHDASTPAWNDLASPDNANNTIRAVVLDPAGETLALGRPGVDLIVKGGSGVDTVYVTPGATVDATQLGLGQDVIHLQGDSGDYSGTVSGSIVTLTRPVGSYIETLKFLGGSNSAFDQILFGNGAAKSVDVLNTLKASLALDTLTLDPMLTSTQIALL
jgi:hypothetical protein